MVSFFCFPFPTGLAILPTSGYKEISFSKENFLILVLSQKAAGLSTLLSLGLFFPPRLMESLDVRGKGNCLRVVCCMSSSMSGQAKSERLIQLSGTPVRKGVWLVRFEETMVLNQARNFRSVTNKNQL